MDDEDDNDNSLFRTPIGSSSHRDPRMISVVISCQYSVACLFLGMFLILSGIMIVNFAETKSMIDKTNEWNQQQAKSSFAKRHQIVAVTSSSTISTIKASNHETESPNPGSGSSSVAGTGSGAGTNQGSGEEAPKEPISKLIGMAMLIAGLVMTGLAIVLFLFASIMFLKTQTHPPPESSIIHWSRSYDIVPDIVVWPEEARLNDHDENQIENKNDHEDHKLDHHEDVQTSKDHHNETSKEARGTDSIDSGVNLADELRLNVETVS